MPAVQPARAVVPADGERTRPFCLLDRRIAVGGCVRAGRGPDPPRRDRVCGRPASWCCARWPCAAAHRSSAPSIR